MRGTDHCRPVGLSEIWHLPANHGHNSYDMDTQIYAVDMDTQIYDMDTQIYAVQRYCPQDTTSSMLTLSRGAERQPSFGQRAEAIPKTVFFNFRVFIKE